MRNEIDIQSDGININVRSIVKVSMMRKLFITLVAIGMSLTYILFVIEIEQHELRKLFVPTMLASALFIYFPWKHWFWNFFGKENIVINAETITYFHDFGITKSMPHTVDHYKLTTLYDSVKQHNGEEWGRLQFISYNTKKKRTVEIYLTEILAPRKDLEKIQYHLSAILNNDSRQDVAA